MFAGCFTFPFGSEQFPLDWMKAYLVITGYGIIGVGLAGVYGTKRGETVYLMALALTAVGLLCRFLLEFGEVSNTWNFTPLNIAAYLLITPLLAMLVYYVTAKHLAAR